MKAALYLLTIYLVWGSTYLAMRIGVMEGSGFPPFMLGAARFLIAGPVLLLISHLMKKRIRIASREIKELLVSGLIIWLVGHGLILWSSQFVDSSYTALIVASSPMWVLIINSIANMRTPKVYDVIFIFIGFLGVAALVVPKISADAPGGAIAVLMIVLGTIGWAGGSLYQRKLNMKLSSLTMSGYQQLFAGLGFLVTSMVIGEPSPNPSTDAWIALAYLVVFGSIIAFTVYVKILVMLPVNVVMTYAYVNPLVAVILGYLVLNEQISYATLLGGIIILVSVFGIMIKMGKKVQV